MRTIKYSIFLLGFLLHACQSNTKNSSLSTPSQPSMSKEIVKASPPVIKKTILFFGNSITAGYLLDIEDAYPAIIQNKIDSLGLPFLCINAGLSGETTSSGLERIDWVLNSTPDIFILELGANDGLRGIDLALTKKNLVEIIKKVKKVNPDVTVIVAGMKMPPNLGITYTKEFELLFEEVVKEAKGIYIPFLLEGVAGIPELNLPDGIHPTKEGHQMVAETVWTYLRPLLTANTLSNE